MSARLVTRPATAGSRRLALEPRHGVDSGRVGLRVHSSRFNASGGFLSLGGMKDRLRRSPDLVESRRASRVWLASMPSRFLDAAPEQDSWSST